jgi:hypothetical protein
MGNGMMPATAATQLMTPDAAAHRAQAALHLERAFHTVIAPAARLRRNSAILAFDVAQTYDAADLAAEVGYAVTVLMWRGKPTGRLKLVWPERLNPPLPEGRPPYPRRSPIWQAEDPDYTPWRRFRRWLGLTSRG